MSAPTLSWGLLFQLETGSQCLISDEEGSPKCREQYQCDPGGNGCQSAQSLGCCPCISPSSFSPGPAGAATSHVVHNIVGEGCTALYLPSRALDLTLSSQGWFFSGSLFLGWNCLHLGITDIVHGGMGKRAHACLLTNDEILQPKPHNKRSVIYTHSEVWARRR